MQTDALFTSARFGFSLEKYTHLVLRLPRSGRVEDGESGECLKIYGYFFILRSASVKSYSFHKAGKQSFLIQILG